MRALLLIALLVLTACPSGPPAPEPVTPPRPGPLDPPSPDPGPAATACERACARSAQLGCDGAGSDCVDVCERYEQLGGEMSKHPDCQARAADCRALEACRAGQ
jgi:hypothetical protein